MEALPVQKRQGLSGTALKLMACITMLIDHIGASCLEAGLLVPLKLQRVESAVIKKYLGQFVKNRYKNYNGGKVAFPPSVAAKSTQSVHKSAQNA